MQNKDIDGEYNELSAIRDYYFGRTDWYEEVEELEKLMEFSMGYEGWEEGFAVLANYNSADMTDLTNIELDI